MTPELDAKGESAGPVDPRRQLPSVDHLLGLSGPVTWLQRRGRGEVVRALRHGVERVRGELADGVGKAADRSPTDRILSAARAWLEDRDRPSLDRVLNGTGVVLHTNLGRAPLPEAALQAMERVGRGYANLEYDLGAGERGSRYEHCADLLCELTGAEAALVVNNNAAAVALAVNEMAAGAEVVVSRGELVEIGGSFRVPDIVTRSGARLREIGTTNRTRVEDYRRAIGPETGLLLKVHPSNYRVEGFVESVELGELVDLGREAGLPVVHDLGSGLLRPDWLPGFPPEPSPGDSVEAGADLVTWSGDKLLGGPQAGVLVGRREAIARLRRNPLLRAFRVDKTTLAGLEATLRLYRDPARAVAEIPVLRMLAEERDSVRQRADRALQGLESPVGVRVAVRDMTALVGGGSFPGHELPSAGWEVTEIDAEALDAACRSGSPPLVGRVREGAYRIDFRTVLPGEEGWVRDALAAALAGLRGAASRRAGPPGRP
jgi:L-seryl-tRNA(Ser) seleniumtransferase